MINVNASIPQKWDDKVFYYANKLSHKNDTWAIHIDPEKCLVSLREVGESMPTVNEIRKTKPQQNSASEHLNLEGKILFSAGVILFIGDHMLLFKRDELAPSDKLKWTSPAGRADKEPLLVALKEFHEEIIIYDGQTGNPIFLTFPDSPYETTLEATYNNTLARKNFNKPSNSWIKTSLTSNCPLQLALDCVSTHFGEEVIDSSLEGKAKFFTLYDIENNTLELMLPLYLNPETINIESICFTDGEYSRENRLTPIVDFLKMRDHQLVPSMIHLREKVKELA